MHHREDNPKSPVQVQPFPGWPSAHHFCGGEQIDILLLMTNLCNLEFTVRTGKNNYECDKMNHRPACCQTRAKQFISACVRDKGSELGHSEAAVGRSRRGS